MEHMVFTAVTNQGCSLPALLAEVLGFHNLLFNEDQRVPAVNYAGLHWMAERQVGIHVH